MIAPLLAPALKRGDTIGLVMPAGPVQNETHFLSGIRLLKDMGFKVKFARDPLAAGSDYLAGCDADRADELHILWADPEVNGLMAVRGGYGCMRILEHLDLDLIRHSPKLFVGFSDITVLLNYITSQTGLVTMHGPVLTTLSRCDSRTIDSFYNTVTGRMEHTIKPGNLEILAGRGKAQGILMGGNLTTLTHLLATPFEPPLDGSILFLEDVGEAPYRIDRILTQIKLAGRFDTINGLILGSFTADLSDDSGEIKTDEPVWQRILDLFGESGIPIWGNFPIGHGPENRTLPVGLPVELDSSAGILHLTGPSTRIF